MAGSMDFASSLYGYVIYAACKYGKYVGIVALAVVAVAMMVWSRVLIIREERETAQEELNGGSKA